MKLNIEKKDNRCDKCRQVNVNTWKCVSNKNEREKYKLYYRRGKTKNVETKKNRKSGIHKAFCNG